MKKTFRLYAAIAFAAIGLLFTACPQKEENSIGKQIKDKVEEAGKLGEDTVNSGKSILKGGKDAIDNGKKAIEDAKDALDKVFNKP